MAVLTKGSSQTMSSNVGDSERFIEVAVDLSDSRLPTGPNIKMDLTEDAWEFGAPPVAGRYKLKPFIGRDGFKMGYSDLKDKDNSLYYSVGIESKIVSDDSDSNGVSVFNTLSTKLVKRKGISTMAGFLVKLGAKIPIDNPTPLQQAKWLKSVLSKEPMIEAELDWRGSYQEADTSWVNAFNSMNDFPPNPDNPKERLHIVSITRKSDGSKVEVRAQLNVRAWYGKGEEGKGKGASKQVNGKQVEFADASKMEKSTPVVQPVQQQQQQQQQQQSVEDDLAMLEE